LPTLISEKRVEVRRYGAHLARVEVAVVAEDQRPAVVMANPLGDPFGPVAGLAHERDCRVPEIVHVQTVEDGRLILG